MVLLFFSPLSTNCMYFTFVFQTMNYEFSCTCHLVLLFYLPGRLFSLTFSKKNSLMHWKHTLPTNMTDVPYQCCYSVWLPSSGHTHPVPEWIRIYIYYVRLQYYIRYILIPLSLMQCVCVPERDNSEDPTLNHDLTVTASS